MRHLKTFEKYYIKDSNIVYHYTSEENAMSIIYQGELKYRRYNIQNKYLSGSASEDYGYVSFTENDFYHEESSAEIPIEVRFVFDLDKLEKDYKVFPYDANQDEVNDYKSMYGDEDGDLSGQYIPHYGEEMELRIYEKDIPLTKYLDSIEFGEVDSEELINLCKEKNIIYKEDVYA